MAGRTPLYLSQVMSNPQQAPAETAASLLLPIRRITNNPAASFNPVSQTPVHSRHLPDPSVRPRLLSNMLSIPSGEVQQSHSRLVPHPPFSGHFPQMQESRLQAPILPPQPSQSMVPALMQNLHSRKIATKHTQEQSSSAHLDLNIQSEIQNTQKIGSYHQNKKRYHQERMMFHQESIHYHVKAKTADKTLYDKLLEQILKAPCDKAVYQQRCQLEQSLLQHQHLIHYHEGRLNHHRARAHYHTHQEVRSEGQYRELIAMAQKEQQQQPLPHKPSKKAQTKTQPSEPRKTPTPLHQPRIHPTFPFIPPLKDIRSQTEQRVSIPPDSSSPHLPPPTSPQDCRPKRSNLQAQHLNYPAPARADRTPEQAIQNSNRRVVSFRTLPPSRQEPSQALVMPKTSFLHKRDHKKS